MEEDSFVESIDSLIKTIKDLIVRPIQRFTGFASLGLLLVVLLLTALVFLFMGVLKIMQGLGVLIGFTTTGFGLGAVTAMMGEKAAMACTVAVEKVIGEHYREQQDLLEDDHKELRKTIKKFEKDELDHHDIGIDHDAENAPGYKVMTKVIEIGCKTAIAISKKI